LELKIPVLKLPPIFRKFLSIPLSTLYIPSNCKQVRKVASDYSVGDIVSQTIPSKIKFFDGKTRRSVLKKELIREERYESAVNPPGTLALNVFTMLKCNCVSTYFIHGEEDLVPLAVGVEKGGNIAYGQPDIGVVIIRTDRFYAINLIKVFKPGIVEYAICNCD